MIWYAHNQPETLNDNLQKKGNFIQKCDMRRNPKIAIQ